VSSGREGQQELPDVPVVDVTEAAASTARDLGHRDSVISTVHRAGPLMRDSRLSGWA